jgi:hypothetical protein
MNERAKWAYLNYSSIQSKIDDGTLDSYDVIYTKDTHENYVISPDLEPWAVRSRIYVFNSEDEANTQLNINTDTYVGQIVSIFKGEVCKGYIVNKNQDDTYYVEQISPDNIDYNNLGNRPIENLVGTFVSPIYVDTLNSGIYKIKGEYKITEDGETVYLSTSGDLFSIEVTDTEKHIKRFTKDSIYDFVIKDNGIVQNKYATEDDVNRALEDAINESIKEYIENEVNNIIESKVIEIINNQFDGILNEKITPIEDEEIEELFE